MRALAASQMMAGRDGGGGTGSARRQRERRLRSMLRHERMSVAMALAESTHHSAQRQKTARAGREARVVLHGHVPKAPLPQGSGPPCLGEPRRPQDQDQLRTMEQAAAYAPMVQILGIPVPQLVDQLVDVKQKTLILPTKITENNRQGPILLFFKKKN